MSDDYRSLMADVAWFIDHLDNAPTQMHRGFKSVWSDPADGAGSLLGSVDDTRAWRQWLEAGERMIDRERYERSCNHPGISADERAAGAVCPSCSRPDLDGTLVESGRVTVESETYRWPMRAAMAKLARIPHPDARPDMALTLRVLARTGGHLGDAAALLAPRWPVMGDPRTARSHFRHALLACRKRYVVDVPARVVSRRSDAQLDAEAAGRVSVP